jgi:hypothetical protein
MTTDTDREQQIGYVAELFAAAFYLSRGIGAVPDESALITARSAGARIALTDQSGQDLDSVREIASALLIGQDFKAAAVLLFVDDLVHDSIALGREMRNQQANI